MDKEKIRKQIDDFLENKVAPLDKNIKMAIYLGAVVLPVALFVYFVYLPGSKEMKSLEKKQATLEREIAEVEVAVANLEKHKTEMRKTEVLLEKASILLPQKKDIPSLLVNISQLGRDAGLDFLSFSPQGQDPKEFYNEVPVAISVEGPYHSIGSFLFQVSKLDRIVSAFNISMNFKALEFGEAVLSSSMTLVTYRFIEGEKK